MSVIRIDSGQRESHCAVCGCRDLFCDEVEADIFLALPGMPPLRLPTDLQRAPIGSRGRERWAWARGRAIGGRRRARGIALGFPGPLRYQKFGATRLGVSGVAVLIALRTSAGRASSV